MRTRRIFLGLFLLVVLAIAGDARAAELGASCSAPVWDNRGTCPAPVLTSASDSVWLHLAVYVQAMTVPIIHDSLQVPRWNGRMVRSWQVPVGLYNVRAYAAKHFYVPRDTIVPGCDTTITIKAVDLAAPGKPRVSPSQ